MNVEWTESALEQLHAIHQYIAQSSPAYAQKVVDRLTRRTQQIENFPLSGRIVPECEMPQIREIIEGQYRLIYHIKPDQIDIIALLHTAQQTPWEM